MSALFLKILNMSVCASWIAAAVLILRFCLKRAPKWVNVLLWGFVAARLICPVSIESALSLIPRADAISSAVLTAPGQTAAAPVIGGAAAAGAAALVWQSVALGLPRRWLRAVLPLLCLICAAVFSGRFLAGAITVSSAACETLTKATGHILLPLAGVGADAALFVAISAALLGTLCAYAVRWSPTVCGLLLTALSAALLALLRPDSAQVWMAACPLCAALLLAGGAAGVMGMVVYSRRKRRE